MSKTATRPSRSIRKGTNQDLGGMQASKYNEAAGGDKVIIVEPVVKKPVAVDEIVGAGALVKVSSGGTYDLKCLGREYDPSRSYDLGDISVSGGKVYVCNEDRTTGAFDASKWIEKADAVISGIPVASGAVVPTGRWHNAISLAGFLVEDDTYISWNNQRR